MDARGYDISKITLPTTGKRFNESDFVDYMECMKTLDVSTYNPPSWLQHTETPFKWAQVLNPNKFIKYDTVMKLEDYPEEDSDGCYSYEKFSLYLVGVFQSAVIKEYEKAQEALQELKNFTRAISKQRSDDVYNRIGPALEHVLSAVTAQVSFINNVITEEESKNIGFGLVPFSEMKPETKAGIEAIKARFYLACSSDIDIALKHIKEATKLDSEYAAWLYWAGKVTRKLRRSKHTDQTEEEISYFKSAVEKKRDPKYILFLAQGYREKAHKLFIKQKSSGHCNSNMSEKLSSLNKRSHELYIECWNLKKDSSAINKRLGNGMMSLKMPYADYKLAEDALISAWKLSNNPNTLHMLGSFYMKYKKDYQKAIEYFIQGAEHGLLHCFNELIRFKYIFVPDYDPYEDLKIEEDAMKYSADLPSVYTDFLWYYLSIKHDISKAVEYFFKVLEKKDDDCLTRFRSYSFCIKGVVNMYSILKNEIHRFQEENKEGENNQILKKFLDKIEDNPFLISQDNKAYSLSSVETASSKLSEGFRKDFKFNYLEVKNHGWAKESPNYFNKKYKVKETNWRNEPKEIKPFNSSKKSTHQTPKSFPNKTEVTNWRSECKNN